MPLLEGSITIENVRAALDEAEVRVRKLRAILAALQDQPAPRAAPDAGLLTKRQREVLELVAEGRPNAAIATALGMSENTVRIHVSAILKTLGLNNRTEAALWWRENGGEQ